MININILNSFESEVDPSLLEKAAQTTLKYHIDTITSSLSLVLSDDDHLLQLNQQFKDIDSPTDVLSFQGDYIDPDSKTHYLGDVVISFTRAEAQATNAGHSVESELQLLVVHGILHLLGYDHVEDHDKARMWSAQSEILARLGVDVTPP